jgi:hypothetical protein
MDTVPRTELIHGELQILDPTTGFSGNAPVQAPRFTAVQLHLKSQILNRMTSV